MTSKLPMLIKMNILPFAVTSTLKSSQHLLFSCRWANILAMMQLQQQQQQQRQVPCTSEYRYFVRNALANSVINLLNCLCTWKFLLCFCITEQLVICNAMQKYFHQILHKIWVRCLWNSFWWQTIVIMHTHSNRFDRNCNIILCM